MADQENATAMVFRQTGQVVECAPGIVGTVAIGPEEAVQGVDDEQPGVGSLKGVFEHGYVTKAQSGGLGRAGGEGTAQQDEARGITLETGKPRAEKFGGSVPPGGVKAGAGTSTATAGRGGRFASSTEGGGNGEGDPGFSGARVSGEDGKSASGEAVFPKPVYGAGLDVCEADQVSLTSGGGWGYLA
jgi:hypothetical protein